MRRGAYRMRIHSVAFPILLTIDFDFRIPVLFKRLWNHRNMNIPRYALCTLQAYCFRVPLIVNLQAGSELNIRRKRCNGRVSEHPARHFIPIGVEDFKFDGFCNNAGRKRIAIPAVVFKPFSTPRRAASGIPDIVLAIFFSSSCSPFILISNMVHLVSARIITVVGFRKGFAPTNEGRTCKTR